MTNAEHYKTSKEAFVSGLTGTTIGHLNSISIVALTSIALFYSLHTRGWTIVAKFILSCVILVMPPFLSMTTLADHSGLLNFALLLPTSVLLLFPAKEPIEPPLPIPASPYQPRPGSFPQNNKAIPPAIQPLPALTTYRAHMMFMTILAILAVDFPVFPRYLAKCETWGVSLMDIGVGSFVFSQGIVSAIPLLKNPNYLLLPFLPKIVRAMKKSSVVILMGVIRVLLVKGVEYPEHESEYGRHWNFFITMALLPVMQVLLEPLMVFMPISSLAVCVGLAQQINLSSLGLQTFVLTAPRDTLIRANKEGIASLIGYFSIHLLGLSLGTKILAPTPSFFRRVQKHVKLQARTHKERDPDPRLSLSQPRQYDKILTDLCGYSFLWWVATYATTGLFGFQVSRRMVNLPYIVWIAAYNTSFIMGYIILDMYFFPNKSGAKLPDPQTISATVSPPPLLSAVNKNGMSIFLIANVMTGIVNLSMKTMYASDKLAMIVLGIYAFSVSLIAWVFRNRRILPI